MSYRFEDQGPTIAARFRTMPPEVCESCFQLRLWRGLAIAACIIAIVGILL